MRRPLFGLVGCMLAAGLIFSQTAQHEVSVTNIQVPVRVYNRDVFVEDLKLEDFELLEDGVPQIIDAVYLIRENEMARKEETKAFAPHLPRHFYFLFQVTNYDPRFKQMIDYFFESVLRPDDTLTIMTPLGNYALSRRALKPKPKPRPSLDMQKVVRKDATQGSGDYNGLVRDLTRLVRSISAVGGVEGEARMNTAIDSDSMQGSFSDVRNVAPLLGSYRATLEKLEGLRVFEEKKLMAFASQMKRLPGEKTVFFFYEREFRPEISDRILGQMMQRFQDEPGIIGDLQDLFQFYQRHVTLNTERIARVFADSSTLLHFIFIRRDPGTASGIRMREQSEDVFQVFSEVARTTGGVIDNSQNPAQAFKTAYRHTGTYYLLYYSPEGIASSGGFRTITVKVKGKDLTISHRRGYIAE